MTFLLDVSVIIALLDRKHVGHDSAHEWFAATGKASWATCPIVENGVVRILSQPSYPTPLPSPAAAATFLRQMFGVGGHVFWHDDLSLLTSPLIDLTRILSSAQITDSYLLALAVARNGRLATLDRRLVTSAVKDGEMRLHIIGGTA
jgi:toxin-antitoxin system PIN domain toxin